MGAATETLPAIRTSAAKAFPVNLPAEQTTFRLGRNQRRGQAIMEKSAFFSDRQIAAVVLALRG
ncbi:MAG: hypothetical protein WCB12_04755 [Bryobacteraceae bacterium]